VLPTSNSLVPTGKPTVALDRVVEAETGQGHVLGLGLFRLYAPAPVSVAVVRLERVLSARSTSPQRIVQDAACPVIPILETSDSEFVNAAAIVLAGVVERTLPIRLYTS
jgi:hypothetical protein